MDILASLYTLLHVGKCVKKKKAILVPMIFLVEKKELSCNLKFNIQKIWSKLSVKTEN